jgi:G3E family GTPase
MSIPLVLVTGFLGAGKTTLLNNLLALPGIAGRKVALLVNEFGEVGIDGGLLRDSSPDTRPIVELNRGSIFCTCIKNDLAAALGSIRDEIQPELVLAEATGLAQTADLLSAVEDPLLRSAFSVRTNICVVDAVNYFKVLPFLKVASGQVVAADGVMINKCNQVSGPEIDKLRIVVGELNPGAPMCISRDGTLEETFFTSLGHTPKPAPLSDLPPLGAFSVTIRPTGPLDWGKFVETANYYGQGILRLKGHVDFGSGLELVERTGEKLSVGPALAGNKGAALVVICWKLNKPEVEDAFARCMV